MATITAALRSDKRKTPTMHTYETVKAGDVVNGRTYWSLGDNGRAANVKVTSVKTWKTRPDIEIHLQFGMYEHWVETYANRDVETSLMVEV